MSWTETFFPYIISEEGRANIKKHKYVPGVKSLLMPYLDYWWEIAVTFVPRWIAPNLVTLFGWLISMIAFYVYCYCEPNFNGTYDSTLMYLYQAITLFSFQTLDAIDGKHARRTLNSSPLGQLFDHGCDAFLITCSTPVHAGIMGMGTGWTMLYVIIMSEWVFFALNWRARHTGQFDFGQFSVDETMLLGIIVHLITAFYGTSFWKDIKLLDSPYLTPPYFLLISCSLSILQNCTKAYIMVRRYYNNENIKFKKFYGDRYWEIGNVLIFHISICIWNTSGIFNKYPTLFISTISFTFAHLIHRLIICDVAKIHSRKFQYIIIPYIICAIFTIFEMNNIQFIPYKINDIKIIIAVLLYSACVTLNYAIRCMLEISGLLQINIFAINPPKNNKKH